MNLRKLSVKQAGVFIATSTVILLAACNSTQITSTNARVHALSDTIKYNQVGYYPNASKIKIVPSLEKVNVEVIDNNGKTVLESESSAPQYWSYSGESVVKLDLSSIKSIGTYFLKIDDSAQAITFEVTSDPYSDMHKEGLRAYYINRAGIELLPNNAGDFARPMGHPDTEVFIHESASSEARPSNSVISSPKGWYDAGDYNKYIVNSGISTYTLLLAYDHFKESYEKKSLNIPESNNNIPDILDEIAWNVEWMSTMQDPNDGGVYHKLTTLNFSPIMMPHEGNEPRYVVQKTTSAALNFSAVMAYASRIYNDVKPDIAKAYLVQAIDAYTWAIKNPNIYYQQPEDVKTGEYGDNDVTDEFAWASAELFIATSEGQFLDNFEKFASTPQTPSWAQASALPYISLLTNARAMLSDKQYSEYKKRLLNLANDLVNQHENSAYAVAMSSDDFVWGSNGVAMNKALVLWQAYRLDSHNGYKVAAEGLVNYVLGANPTGYSFVTGFGKFPPMHPHHRQSEADNVVKPVPGFLIGGPHSGQQDSCDYPSNLAAQSFLDDWCSYSTNEVTINWNAPFVYSLAQMHDLHKD